MIFLGLDPSLTSFGFSLIDDEIDGPGRILYQGRFRTSAKTLDVERYLFLQKSLRQLIEKSAPVFIGMESPFTGGSYSEGLWALFVHNCEVLYELKKDFVLLHPPQLHLLAKGDPAIKKKMFKIDMIKAAKKDMQWKGKFQSDEADAYHAAKFGARFYRFINNQLTEADLTPAEHHVFHRTHKFVRGIKAGLVEEYGILTKENNRFFLFSKLDEERPDPGEIVISVNKGLSYFPEGKKSEDQPNEEMND